ncbi:MAG: EAL domain-containing protein [Thermodesulfobacteriaceae bacterium]|nr:EAL domain-containing protein [Thermodesulfobacteriaceae bacterium]
MNPHTNIQINNQIPLKFFHLLPQSLTLFNKIIVITDSYRKIVYANPVLFEITKFSETEVLNKSFSILTGPLEFEPYFEEMWKSLKERKSYSGVLPLRKKDYTTFRCEITAFPLIEGEALKGYFFLIIPLGIKEKPLKLDLLEEEDKVTGLKSLKYLLKIVDFHIYHSPENPIIFMVLDLDKFSLYTSYYGLKWTDQLLKRVGERLREAFEKEALIGRSGTDDFFLIFLDQGKSQIPKIVDTIFRIFSIPFIIEDKVEKVSINLGGSTYPEDGASAEELYNKSFLALDLSKKRGPNHFLFFNEECNQHLLTLFQLRDRYFRALKEKRFIFYVQPIYKLSSLKIMGFEILLRLLGENGQIVSPSFFLNILEDQGLIKEVEFFVLENLKNLKNKLPEKLLPFINLSYQSFLDPYLLTLLREVREELNRPLVIEVTEKVYLEERVFEVLKELEKLELLLALDDFGTGYSSLSYLIKLSANYLKIDKTFVQGIFEDKIRKLVEGIIKLAQSLNLRIIGEGVENQAQLSFLKSLKCDYAQGFLFCKPLPLERFLNLVVV